jgi:hypothetical protein
MVERAHGGGARVSVREDLEKGERAHARGASFTLAPGFVPAQRGPLGADWAVIALEAPLREPILPLAPLPPAGGAAGAACCTSVFNPDTLADFSEYGFMGRSQTARLV